MKQLTIWAGQYKKLSFSLTALLLIIFCLFSFVLGAVWKQWNIELSTFYFLSIPFAIFFFIMVRYPSRKNIATHWKNKSFFRKWKSFDLAMILAVGMLFQFMGNQDVNFIDKSQSIEVIDHLTSEIPLLQVTGNTSNTKKHWFKNFIKKTGQVLHKLADRILPDQAENKSFVILMLILLYLAYFLLALILAYAFCFIACSDMPILAFVVLFGGLALMVGGFYYSARQVFRKYYAESKDKKKKSGMWALVHTFIAFIAPVVLVFILSLFA